MSEHLRSIQSPADIKSMSIAELTELAQEIRELLISSLSKTGGHLGPNLGVVELTLAMHYVFDTPADKFKKRQSHGNSFCKISRKTAKYPRTSSACRKAMR